MARFERSTHGTSYTIGVILVLLAVLSIVVGAAEASNIVSTILTPNAYYLLALLGFVAGAGLCAYDE